MQIDSEEVIRDLHVGHITGIEKKDLQRFRQAAQQVDEKKE